MCALCGTLVEPGVKPGRRDLCPACGRELRTCLNCRFYSPGSQWDCSESIDQAVREKDRANFCDWFSYVARTKRGGDAKKGLDSLFS